MLKRVIIFIATGVYTGYSPWASGTVGSVIGILLYLLFPQKHWVLYLVLTLILFLIGCWAAGRAEAIFETKDSSFIVIDEIVGFLAVMFLVPRRWYYLVPGFFIYRLMDIIKPFPARQLEGVAGGWGIMLDDIAAAIYTNIVLQLMRFMLLAWR